MLTSERLPDLAGAVVLWGIIAVVLGVMLRGRRWPKVRARVLAVHPSETRNGEWSLLLDVPQPGNWSREEEMHWAGRAPPAEAGQFVTLHQNPMDPREVELRNMRAGLPFLLGLIAAATGWTLAIIFLD